MTKIGDVQFIFDPGHGGTDHGLSNDPQAAYTEKDLCLRLLKASNILNSGYTTAATRLSDINVSDEARIRFSSQEYKKHPGPGLLVGLHMASSKDKDMQGFNLLHPPHLDPELTKSIFDSISQHYERFTAPPEAKPEYHMIETASYGNLNIPYVVVEVGYISNQATINSMIMHSSAWMKAIIEPAFLWLINQPMKDEPPRYPVSGRLIDMNTQDYVEAGVRLVADGENLRVFTETDEQGTFLFHMRSGTAVLRINDPKRRYLGFLEPLDSFEISVKKTKNDIGDMWALPSS